MTLGDFSFRIDPKSAGRIGETISLYNLASQNIQSSFGSVISKGQAYQSELNKLTAALSSIDDGVVGVDINRKVMIFNRSAELLFSIPASKALGQDIGNLIKIFNETGEISEFIYCPTETRTLSEVVFNQQSARIESATKKISFADLTVHQIYLNRQILGCILTFHDVTSEKQLEEMKFDFVSMAAHELRTPLTSIKGYLSVFISENAAKLNPEQNMFLKRIDDSAQQLLVMVENLLNVTKIERGGITINVQPLDWALLVKDTVEMFQPKAKEKQIILKFIPPTTTLPPVLADKVRIVEVLSNFISNAIKYTQVSGEVTVSIEKGENDVITHVADNGPGIPKSAQRYLFNKFSRINGHLDQSHKGNGLGLYIAKSIVDLHHGKAWLDSDTGKGAIFSFSLPL